jgi:hypothetical protein
MDSINSDTYKKQNLFQLFFNSCLGKIVIFLLVLLVLWIFAIITVPSKTMMLVETCDNIHECLQDNDSIRGDEIDETINNIARTFSIADTTKTNQELWKTFLKYNRLEVYEHPGFKTVHVVNGQYPQGRRIAIGLFQGVISTIFYDDLVITTGAARGEYNKKLNQPQEIPDEEFTGEDLNVEAYHYNGDPDN